MEAFTSTGTLIRIWGGFGAADGQFAWGAYNPNLAVDAAGDVYVADTSNGRVQVFDATGNFLRKWQVDGAPTGIAIDTSQNVYVASGTVRRYSQQGVLLGSYTPPTPAFAVAADRDGNVLTAGGTSIWKIDPSTPEASLSVASPLALTGQPVSLDASSSLVPFGAVADYQWDLDANGTFETDTATTPSATVTYVTRGTRTITVRAIAPGGQSATAAVTVDARQAPPSGLIGMSINNGAQFTNDPRVLLTPAWPAFALTISTSNDGGFAGAETVPVDTTIPWTLSSSGPERLPKTVYARFDGSTQTFQDDIILDQTPPVVTKATVVPSTLAATRQLQTRATQATIRLVADDGVSGVSNAQFAVDRAAPSPARRFAPTMTATGTPRYVRVQDGAGNWSSWRTIANTAPTLTISSTRLKTLARGLTIRISCARACTVRATARVPASSARRLHLHGSTLASGKGRRTSAGTVTLHLRPTSAIARRAAKQAKLKIAVRATVTTSGKTQALSKTVTLR